MSTLLHTLNNGIVVSIFCEWVQLENLTIIDTAFCNKVDRIFFHRIISADNFVQADIKLKSASTIDWVVCRRIKVAGLDLRNLEINNSRDILFLSQLIRLNNRLRELWLNASLIPQFVNIVDKFQLNSLIIEDSDDIAFSLVASNLEKILQLCGTTLTMLNITSCQSIDVEICPIIAKLCPNLQHYRPSCNSVECLAVTDIDLYADIEDFRPENLKQVLINCPKLTSLTSTIHLVESSFPPKICCEQNRYVYNVVRKTLSDVE
jgi:hypothetical protein